MSLGLCVINLKLIKFTRLVVYVIHQLFKSNCTFFGYFLLFLVFFFVTPSSPPERGFIVLFSFFFNIFFGLIFRCPPENISADALVC